MGQRSARRSAARAAGDGARAVVRGARPPRMKIAYVFDRPLPARETDSEQALQTLSAFARRGAEVRLVLPASGQRRSARELAEHYRVQGDFELVYAPTPFGRWVNARKWWHATHAIQLPEVKS